MRKTKRIKNGNGEEKQTLSADRVLALLVLGDLVEGVLLALGPRAKSLHLLGDRHHFLKS